MIIIIMPLFLTIFNAFIYISMIQYGYAFQTEAKIQIKPTEAIAFVCSAIVTSLGIASTMEFGGIVGGTVVGIGIFMVIVIATIILERR